MRLEFHPAVLEQLQRLPLPAFGAALHAVVDLADEPRPVGGKKLSGSGDDRRIPVSEYRIIYSTDDPGQTVTILLMAHRRNAYRWRRASALR